MKIWRVVSAVMGHRRPSFAEQFNRRELPCEAGFTAQGKRSIESARSFFERSSSAQDDKRILA